MDEEENNMYFEKVFKIIFYGLVGIPILFISAFFILFILTLWYSQMIQILRGLISILPIVWALFSVTVFVCGVIILLILKIKKITKYKKDIKKIIITSGVFILLFLLLVYVFLILKF